MSSTILKTALDNYQTYLIDWTGLPTILDTKVFETFRFLGKLTIVTHGNVERDISGHHLLGRIQKTVLEPNLDASTGFKRLTLYGLEEANKKQRIRTSESEYNDAVSYLKIINSVAENGTYLGI